MYLDHWGLKKFPFDNVPDPEFMFYSPDHREALARLVYAVTRNKGAVLLTGEVGCGKTMLSRVFIQQLTQSGFEIGLITNPSLSPIDFLIEALTQIGLNAPSDSKPQLLTILNNCMVENMQKGRTTLFIIDEAQTISEETLEEIRLLLNFQLNDRFLLTLVLIGQPELRDKIRAYKQLNQRIANRYHLNPLNADNTRAYIAFRLEKAGRANNMFTPEAIDEIYNASQGVPRIINNICDLALLVGFSSKINKIDIDTVSRVIKDSI
jgi:general secretion pathway protein A